MSLQGATDARLLLILGADRPERIVRKGERVGMGGLTDLHKLLDPGVPFHRLQLTPNYFRQAKRPELDDYRCLFNMITEAEGNEKVLDVLRKLARQLPGRLINRPEAVLRTTRDQVARRLSAVDGLRAPKAIRLRGGKPDQAMTAIERAGLELPLIVRNAGTHTGKILGRFDHADPLRAALAGAEGELIATEFVDFRSADGLYRKYRIFFIGDRYVLRHLLVFDQWNIHWRDGKAFMVDKPQYLEEEKALLERPEGAFPQSVHRVLGAIRERMGLDFFGLDFAIGADGRPILFESNATMNFFPFSEAPEFAYAKSCIAPARAAFRRMIGLEPGEADIGALHSAA